MASKKKNHPTKVCRIWQWIEGHDEQFAGLIRNLCMEGALAPGFAGVTFLYPEDKAYRDSIIDADGDEAVKMVQSLIIPEGLLIASDFQSHPIGSYSGVLYAVEETSKDTVKLQGGIMLKKADDFHLLQYKEGDRLAVWNITAGRLPLTGAEYQRPRKGRTEGGARHAKRGGESHLSKRATFAATIEKEFDDCMKADGCMAKDPYLAKSVSLLDFLREKHPDIFQTVLPLIDWNPIITFYLLIEPYRTIGDYIIPDGILFGDGGWNGAETFTDAVSEYKKIFECLRSSDSPAYVFKDHASVVHAVDLIRQRVAAISDKMSLVRLVKEHYNNLTNNNSIGGLSPIYPDSTLALLRGGKKLWQDEFRFIVCCSTKQLYANARATPSKYTTDDWASLVRSFRNDYPGNNYEAEETMVKKLEMKSNVSPTEDFLMLQKFGNSTDFLYTPAPEGMVGGYMGSEDDPTDMAVYNRNYDAMRAMSRTRTRRHVGVSPQALTELRMYAAKNGGSLAGLGI
jgi:hypothetical protein